MSMTHVAGSNAPVVTNVTTTLVSKDQQIVEVEGPYADVVALAPAEYCPSSYTIEDAKVSSTGDGGGKMTILCVNYGSDQSGARLLKTTWRVEMAEVSTNLKHHPHFQSNDAVRQIDAWLNTDAADRFDDQGNAQYVDAEGEKHPLTAPATDYVKAYVKGIETYNRYFPVVQKISTYSRLPGGTMSERSTTGGTATFSTCGTFDPPELSLQGYASAKFFKSGDAWQENNDRTWTRTQEWTWTPDKSADTSWIYS